MADVTSSATAASGLCANPSAAASPTFGAQVDAEIILLKSRVASLERAGKKDWAKFVAGLKSNWAHFVTWAAVAGTNPIVIDLIRKVL